MPAPVTLTAAQPLLFSGCGCGLPASQLLPGLVSLPCLLGVDRPLMLLRHPHGPDLPGLDLALPPLLFQDSFSLARFLLFALLLGQPLFLLLLRR